MNPKVNCLVYALFCLSTLACGDGDDPASDSSSTQPDLGGQSGLAMALASHPMLDGTAVTRLAGVLQTAEAARAGQEILEQAKGAMESDPSKAVDLLQVLASLESPEADPTRSLREARAKALGAVLEKYETADRYLEYGEQLYLLGKPNEAREAFLGALGLAGDGAGSRVVTLCWLGACDAVLGNGESSQHAIAKAAADIEEKARVLAASRPERPTSRPQFESVLSDGWVPTVEWTGDDGTGLGFGAEEQFGGFDDGFGAGQASRSAQLESDYLRAKADYDADYARWEAESRLGNDRGGRFGVLGVTVNPRPVDQGLYLKYLNAKSAYEGSSGGW